MRGHREVKLPMIRTLVSSVSDPSRFDIPDPRIHIWKKWIRTRILGYLFLLLPKFRKGISQINYNFLLYIVLVCFGASRIQINARSGSGSGARIEVDPDPKRC